TADFTAARFAKYGVNAVRMHKFSYPTDKSGIGDHNDSTRMDPKGLDRLDYFASKLKESGVYFGWSHTYGFHVGPGDSKRLLAYDEIAKNLQGNTYAFIHFAEDVQDLMIEMVVNLLKQKGGGRQRLLDTAAFLHEVQDKFYGRFVKAIRDAGYKGPLCGSPWQAPSMAPHYYNLYSDYKVGFIDRHNYFEGKGPD